mgnify:CR=1 FL=1
MSHESESLETRLARCERTLFGEDDSSKGLSARMHMTETTTAKIDAIGQTNDQLDAIFIAAKDLEYEPR